MPETKNGVSHPRAAPIDAAEFARLMAACAADSIPGFASGFSGGIAVAVSGGADSMALCLLAHDWARTHDLRFVALSVDHGLRAGSDEEAAQVGQWLNAHGITHHTLTWDDGAGRATAVQARARAARYALMGDWCRAQGLAHLLAAHHLEDQAETVLMRLKKGSTLMGLAAMARRRDLGGVILTRPLLDVPKARLRATLRDLGQAWIEDPSNRNPAFERVRTRALLQQLKAQGISAERLAGAARACAWVRTVLERAADELIGAAVRGEGTLHLDAALFHAAPPRVRAVVLSKLLEGVGGAAYPPSPAKLERLAHWLASVERANGAARTLSGCEVRHKGDSILISRERPRKSPKGRKNAQNKCASTLALHAQTSYIQGNQHPSGGAGRGS